MCLSCSLVHQSELLLRVALLGLGDAVLLSKTNKISRIPIIVELEGVQLGLASVQMP